MAESDKVLDQKLDLLKDREAVLAAQRALVSDTLFYGVRRRLLAWTGSAIAAGATLLSILAWFGFNTYISGIATNAVKPSVTLAESAAGDAELAARGAEQEFTRISNALAEAERRIADLDTRMAELQGLAAARDLVTSDAVEARFANMLFAARSTSFFCGAEASEAFRTDIDLHFAAPFSVSGSLWTTTIPLLGPERLFDFSTDRQWSPLPEGPDCIRNRGLLDGTNARTPTFVDVRDLPALNGFVLQSLRVADSDGRPTASEDEIASMQRKWSNLQFALITLELGRSNSYFTRGEDAFREAGWLDDEAVIRPLDAVTFERETHSDGTVMLRAILPLRDAIPLSALIR